MGRLINLPHAGTISRKAKNPQYTTKHRKEQFIVVPHAPCFP
jgi:hypothetical protein